MMFIKLWTNSFWTSVSYGITMPQAYFSESSEQVLHEFWSITLVLEMGKESYRDGDWRVQRKAVWNQNQDLPRVYAVKHCEANYISEELNEVPSSSRWDPLLLNPSRDCMDSCNALFPSQDIKWKGAELARVAAELAWLCGPSGSSLAHANKGSCGLSLEAVGFRT